MLNELQEYKFNLNPQHEAFLLVTTHTTIHTDLWSILQEVASIECFFFHSVSSFCCYWFFYGFSISCRKSGGCCTVLVLGFALKLHFSKIPLILDRVHIWIELHSRSDPHSDLMEKSQNFTSCRTTQHLKQPTTTSFICYKFICWWNFVLLPILL